MNKLMKKLSVLSVIFALAVVLAAPVFAAEANDETEAETTATEIHHVLDAEGLLSEENSSQIEEAAAAVLEKNGVDLFAYVTGKTLKKPDETGNSVYSTYAKTDASLVMMIDKKGAYLKAYGRTESIFSADELKDMLKQAKKQDKTAARFLKYVDLAGESLTEKGVLPIPAGRQQPRLVDDAGLLSKSEKYSLVSKLDSISESRHLDVVVVTNNSLDGKTVEAYADDFFDYNGYGYGVNDDGILLLLSMDTREWAITTYGNAIDIFTDSVQADITDSFLSYISDGDYFSGFNRFADLCDNQIAYYNENGGYSYDYGKEPFGWFTAIGGSLLIGLVVGLIVALSLKSQLTSVKPQAAATAYTKPGSLRITDRQDMFLYHTITRTARPKENSSSGSRSHSSGGGHSSTHTSSSGRSHGGSHGHF